MTVPEAAAALRPIVESLQAMRKHDRFDNWGPDAPLGGHITAHQARAIETLVHLAENI